MNKLSPRVSLTYAFSSFDFVIKTSPLLTAIVCLVICFSARTAIAQAEGQAREEAASARGTSNTVGKISGRVVGEDGRPLANAVVNLFKIYSRTPGQPMTVNTDAEGRFQSPELPPGLYSVSVLSPGYASTLPDLNEKGEPNYYRPGESVNLTMVKGGVITGIVRDASGEPVVAVPVRAVRVRDPNSTAQLSRFIFSRDRMTDDRGIYRIYGLTPGTYLVSAGGNSRFFAGLNAYGGDMAVYYPSSTRDTAAEIVVRAGEEVANVDIRYRSERGRSISGQVSGVSDTGERMGIVVIARQRNNVGFTDQTFIPPSGKPVFSFDGLADGEYELMAQQGSGSSSDIISSTPQRVTVKGADVTGVELALAPLASIAGRMILDPAPKEPCNNESRLAVLPETMINTRRDAKGESRDSAFSTFFNAGGTLLDEQGDFTIRSLAPGNYRLNVRLPDDFWYTRSISLPGAITTQPPARPRPATAKGAQPQTRAPAPSYLITLRTGERSTGTTIRVAQDGAILSGKISSSAEGASLPDNLKVYLIPQERERAEDILRFSEVNVKSDGAFLIRNLAPGRYFILARPAPENESPDSGPRPAFWDADSRAKLRREAETLNAAIDLKPCQRVSDYELRYPPIK